MKLCMVWEGTQCQNKRPNSVSHILKSSINTVLFVNATNCFSANIFLVKLFLITFCW